MKFVLSIVILFSVLNGGSAFADNAPQWACSTPQWVGFSGMRGGNFVGTQECDCTIQLDREGSLAVLDQHILEVVKASKVVSSGPVEEIFLGLPSVAYDVTIEDNDGGLITIRQDIHVATDQKTHLVYSSFSKSIRGSGMTGYLRKLDKTMEVTQGATPGLFLVKLSNTLAVDRPWYAPTGIFVGKVKEAALSQLLKVRAATLPDVASHL